ncbi:MAG: ABC transporter ATP-binding protein [Candidatus Eremiobacterota bacterium]
MINGKSFIELQALSKTYPEGKTDRTVLRDITATVNRGEVIVLLGRSGSGKSTLLNLLCGIDIPSSGHVFINNINITGLSEHERTLFRRKHIGFIFQFFNLIPTLTVEENLLLPLELNGLTGKEEEKKAFEILAQTGLSDRRKSYPDQLSGGEQQRVAIARALSHDPMLILADEPTGNLDFETGQQILSILDDLAGKTGKTMIMATHSKEMVCSILRKVRLLNLNGKGYIEEILQ